MFEAESNASMVYPIQYSSAWPWKRCERK